VDYLTSPFFWLAYVLAIVVFRSACFAYFPKTLVSPETEWTLTNVVHGIVRVRRRGEGGVDRPEDGRRTTTTTTTRIPTSLTPSLPSSSSPQISFVGLHWNRGSPFWEDQGEHIEETVWEQIEGGVPWTSTRKFLLLTPVVLFLVSSHFTNYDIAHLAVNLTMLIILVAAKLPELHGVRIFGINSGKTE
jgi:hypothetical protein